MTLLIAWTGVDSRGPSSVYLASDSRISWKAGSAFDYGRKVFAFNKWPDVLGYCGDVLFPSIALNQIVDLADAGLLFTAEFSCKQKFQAIVDKLNDLFRQYPQLHSGIKENSLSIVHASRDPKNNSFFCQTISWTPKKGWFGAKVEFPSSSAILFSLGTGAGEFAANFARYNAGATKETSRAVFHCFCDALANTSVVSVGGAPQLVGIFRKPASVAITFGVIYKLKRSYLGANVDNLRNFDTIQWRNANFELCDGRTMAKLPNAQAQPDSLRRP